MVQRMVDAKCSGVAFSTDPVTGNRDVVVVSAIFGYGTALVSGESDADTFHVDRDGNIIYRDIANKRFIHGCVSNNDQEIGTVEIVESEARKPALSDEQIREIAELARKAEKYFECPQDIEWALDAEKIYLLQSRPITSLLQRDEPEGTINLWDNSNIAESYNGITTPLTFSFARRAYEEVYRQFCRLMGVSEKRIADQGNLFRCMLGLIQGRVYYTLMNWYRMLAMFPGFSINRGFMEQMMGVKEALPEKLKLEIEPDARPGKIRDGMRLTTTLLGLVVNYFLLPSRINQFHLRLEQVLEGGESNIQSMRVDELTAYYRGLEEQLLKRWDAPLVNDFFTMIFFGVLRLLTKKWRLDRKGTLENDLLCGEGGIISTEPAKKIREMAEIAFKTPELEKALCEDPLSSILEEMERVPEFKTRYHAYLHVFGDRCTEELKLESETLHDNPLPLLRAIGQITKNMGSKKSGSSINHGIEIRRWAEKKALRMLARRPLRRHVYFWVLRQARRRVGDRENLRFERTRVFGRARKIFLEIGSRFTSMDLLESAQDIFYLEVEEILGFVEGTITCCDLNNLAKLRKTHFEKYRKSDSPSDRFTTVGIVNYGNAFTGAKERTTQSSGETAKGLGCCAGIVRGPIRIVQNPKETILREGEILVAERTDPGWITLFCSASGILVERGSLLSHSAIVAREMGIPAIVSIPGITNWVQDGDLVEINGMTGEVRRIEAPKEMVTNGM
jgi:pyruvate,water dikinase